MKIERTMVLWISLFFILVPLIQIIIFQYVPDQIKQAYFVLHLANITITSLFLSNYTHLALSHMQGNLEFYFITIVLISILFSRMKKNRKRIYIDMGLIFIIVPFIISLAEIIAYKRGNLYGFSGIDAALIGCFTYLFVTYLKGLSSNSINQYYLLSAIVFLNLILSPSTLGSYFIFPIIMIAYCLLVNVKGFIKLAKNCLKFIITAPKADALFSLMFGGVFLILALSCLVILPALMQAQVTSIGATDVLGHLSGYILGIFIGYSHILIEYISKRKRVSK